MWWASFLLYSGVSSRPYLALGRVRSALSDSWLMYVHYESLVARLSALVQSNRRQLDHGGKQNATGGYLAFPRLPPDARPRLPSGTLSLIRTPDRAQAAVSVPAASRSALQTSRLESMLKRVRRGSVHPAPTYRGARQGLAGVRVSLSWRCIFAAGTPESQCLENPPLPAPERGC
ncbi:hypothetical protein N656DRAFT_500686 [Canariomyces notabilis]|uniref:Uncharacterized protein n=1 Tax=Canariomyces notabilis TaxID=2074819 RepID=A0AAN6TJB6_9PEZI|nr:hypothetical protein N656DRAFT_500686 [Canariomyces arenarius]